MTEKRKSVHILFPDRPLAPPIDGGGGPPHTPDMEARVAALEIDVKEVKATLGRLEPVLARIDERTKDMVGKADLVRLDERIGKIEIKLDERMKNLPTSESFGRLEGRVSTLPNWWTLLILALITLSFPTILSKLLEKFL
jgi:hypothetical protein